MTYKLDRQKNFKKSPVLCEKTRARLAKVYTCKTIASPAGNSAVPRQLLGQLMELCRPLKGLEHLDYIGNMILVEKRL